MFKQTEPLLFLIVGVALQSHFALYLAYLRAVDQAWEYGLLRVGYQLTKLIAVGGAVLLLKDASAYPVGILAANTALFLLLVPRINRRTQGYVEIGSVSYTVLKQNMLIGIPLTAHAVVGVLYSVTDRFLLERMLDSTHVAIYNFAFVQGTAIFFVINVLALAFVPKIYRGEEYNSETARTLFEFLRASFVGAFALSLVVYFLIFPISLYFVAPEYREGDLVLVLALGAALVHPVALYGLYKLTLLRNVWAVPFITLGGLLLNIALNMLLIPRYGIEGAAGAAFTSEVLYGIVMVMVAHLIANKPHTR